MPRAVVCLRGLRLPEGAAHYVPGASHAGAAAAGGGATVRSSENVQTDDEARRGPLEILDII